MNLPNSSEALNGNCPVFSDGARLYLRLMKRCLTNSLYADREVLAIPPDTIRTKLIYTLMDEDWRLVRRRPYEPQKRDVGRDWPPEAETMIGLARLDNLQHCIESVLQSNIPGDLIETGAWRGGATIFMRACLKAAGVNNRTVWVADSFEGLPPANPAKYPADTGTKLHTREELRVSLDEVKGNFARYELLDDRVVFLKGWFRDTLHDSSIEKLAVLRLDGDMYESTIDVLTALYSKVSAGGYVIVDDYGAVEACKLAVDDFRRTAGIIEEMSQIDWTGVFWQKSREDN